MKNITTKISLALATLFSASAAFAQAAPEAAATAGHDKGLVAMAGALAIGLAALGGALGQAKAASSALEGIARNPAARSQIFTPMIVGLALIESLVLFALLVAFTILSK